MALGKSTARAPKPILDAFYGLASYEERVRETAAVNLILNLQKFPDAVPYCLERLVKGLASSHEAARVGFSIVLTEILKTWETISCKELLGLMDEHLALNGNDAKNNAIGRVLCVLALIRSKKCTQALKETMEQLDSIHTDRPYLELVWAEAVVCLCSMVDQDAFSKFVWPAIKNYCNVGLDSCSPISLWVFLELDKSHHKFLQKKAKLFADGSWPPSNENQFRRLGNIVATGVRCTSSGVHPLESTLLLAMIAGQTFSMYWDSTICGYLIKNDDKLVSLAGLRAISNALSMQPSKQQLAHILSEDTVKELLKSLLDRRPAARFARLTAWNQLTAIEKCVSDNKASPRIQFTILKRILHVSLNFDRVSGTMLVHRLIGCLSVEAAAMITDLLISKLTGASGSDQLQSTDLPVAIRLLHRIFECSKSAPAESNAYRTKILALLANATFYKALFSQLSPSLWSSLDGETIKSTFMRCLECLGSVSISQRTGAGKYDFPTESVAIMRALVDGLVERKRGGLVDKCKLTLTAEQAQLAVKAAKAFRQLSKSADQPRGFLVLIGYCLFWFINSPDEYSHSTADLLVCYEKCQAGEDGEPGASWKDVLMDLLMGILSRPHRYLRTPTQLAFHYFCPVLQSESVQPLLQALKPSDKSVLVEKEDNADSSEGEEEEEDEDEDDDEEEMVDEEEEEMVEEEEEEMLEEDLDEFRRAVEDALGDAAAHSDTESSASDLPDEAMLQLDDSLAAVFRSHLTRTTAKKSARDLAEQAQAFRVRCFDLLFVLLNSQPSADVLLGCVLPLLNVANEAVRMSDQKNLFNRARQAVVHMIHMKTPSVQENDGEQFLATLSLRIKELMQFVGGQCTNPSVQLLTSQCLRFMLKWSDVVTSKEKTGPFESDMGQLFASSLKDFLTDRSCPLPVCVFTMACQKRPVLLADNLPILLESALDTDIRPFRRHQAFDLIRCLLSASALRNLKYDQDSGFALAWTRFTGLLGSSTLEKLSDVEGSSGETRDVCELMTILRSVVNLEETLPLGQLREWAFVEEIRKSGQGGSKQAKLAGGRKVRLSKLCSEIVKRLQPTEDNNDEDNDRRPAKRRKTKE